MRKCARLSLLGVALSLLPILCQGENGAPRPMHSGKGQPVLDHRVTAAASNGKGSYAEVPKKYLGTWVLDKKATTTEIANQAPGKVKERWLKGASDLVRWEWAISADTILYSITTQAGAGGPERAEFRVGLKEEGPEFTILSNVEPSGAGRDIQAFHLRLVDDGSLRLRASTAKGWADDDNLTRYFVYRKEADGGGASAGRGTNQPVAYLDALKACTAGQFHFSYPGLGDFRNTILGKSDERCQVKIVHSNMNLACSFSDETIALLTSPRKYENAKKGVLEGSTDSEESARMNKECRAN